MKNKNVDKVINYYISEAMQAAGAHEADIVKYAKMATDCILNFLKIK